MYTSILFVKSQSALARFSLFTSFFLSFYLLCALVSFISISPCPLGAFGLSQLSAAARPSTNGFSRLLHNSLADCASCAKGCNGGQETQLLPRVDRPPTCFHEFFVSTSSAQLHHCTAQWFQRAKIRQSDFCFRKSHALHFQNLSNCCRNKHDQSIHKFLS